jgi:hypothetical protein
MEEIPDTRSKNIITSKSPLPFTLKIIIIYYIKIIKPASYRIKANKADKL